MPQPSKQAVTGAVLLAAFAYTVPGMSETSPYERSNFGDGAPSEEWRQWARGIEVRAPAFPSSLDRESLALLPDQFGWCGSPSDQPIVLALPAKLDSGTVARGLAHLVFTRSAWSLPEVRRAVELIALADGEPATEMLEAIYADANGIVSAHVSLTVSVEAHAELAAFVAGQAVGLRRAVVRASSRRKDPGSARLLERALKDADPRVRKAAARARRLGE